MAGCRGGTILSYRPQPMLLMLLCLINVPAKDDQVVGRAVLCSAHEANIEFV